MYADPYRRAMRRLLDEVDPKELEQALADFIARATEKRAVPLEPKAPALPLCPLL